MYRRYSKGDDSWLEGLALASEFIVGPLFLHVSTWTRYGQLGVQDGLNCTDLCARLPRLLKALGEFGLLRSTSGQVELLVVEVGDADDSTALCYGRWPGVQIWELEVMTQLSRGQPLSRTFWNRMPRLSDADALDTRAPVDEFTNRRQVSLAQARCA